MTVLIYKEDLHGKWYHKILLLEGIDIDSDKSYANNINNDLECSIFLINKNANGYRNFERFRKRCMFAINKDTPIINPK